MERAKHDRIKCHSPRSYPNFPKAKNESPINFVSNTTRNDRIPTSAMQPSLSTSSNRGNPRADLTIMNSQRDSTSGHRRKVSRTQTAHMFKDILWPGKKQRITKIITASIRSARGRKSSNRRIKGSKQKRMRKWHVMMWTTKKETCHMTTIHLSFLTSRTEHQNRPKCW